MELAQGDHSRSGGQYDIWQAVFSPVGSDGYPKPIFDKVTGEIDKTVAAYWRDHYDLTHIIQRDWATLGPKLAGKIHIYVGSGDTYYLNDAVYYAQDTLENLKNPAYGGEVKYGDRAEHCWNGDPEPAERVFAAALQLQIPAQDPGAHPGDGARRRGSDELEILRSW